ncbi:MAG: pyridoxal phosphate-dependent aminotransferase [Halodesulfurarchaeum sp.]
MEYDEPLFFRVISYAERADRDVIDMVSGNPDWGAPPAIGQGLQEYAELGGSDFQYPPAAGLPELRQAIAEDRGVDPDQVIVTNGAGEANYLGMARALDRGSGSEVVLTDPVYPYYPGKTSMLGGEQVFVETESDGSLDPDAVREAAGPDTACIVVNTPNNPTGAVYPAETMQKLVNIAEAHDALLVSDEVYDRFDHSGAFASALSVESQHRIVTGSFSKTFAITGFRVGYAIAPSEHVEALRTRHMLTNVTGSRPAQYAVLRAMEETPAEYYRQNRRLVRDRIETFTGALEEIGAPYTEPDGAFYVMARIPGLDGTLENAFHLIDDAGVAGMPGESFGTARAGWFRFALVTPRVEEAADRLRAFVEG